MIKTKSMGNKTFDIKLSWHFLGETAIFNENFRGRIHENKEFRAELIKLAFLLRWLPVLQISCCSCCWSADQWKQSITVPVYKKGDKTDSSSYREISLLSISYNFFFNILLSRLSPYIDEIIGEHQCGFRHNRSTTDYIRSKSLWRWYINTIIVFLDIIHRPVFIYNNVSETEFCLRLQVEPTQLGPIDKAQLHGVS
jgi:hypothetical protein